MIVTWLYFSRTNLHNQNICHNKVPFPALISSTLRLKQPPIERGLAAATLKITSVWREIVAIAKALRCLMGPTALCYVAHVVQGLFLPFDVADSQ